MKVKDLIEVALLYVGIPAVALYPLGFVGLLIQLWRDDFFPYEHFNTIWNAVALVPHTVVIGTGIELLYLSLASTLVGLGVASLTLNFLHKRHAEEAENHKSLWSLYLVVLLPVAALLLWNSVHVYEWYDLLFLAGFLVFSAGGGILLGYIRVMGHDQWFFPRLVAAYVGAVLAALCIATLNAPALPLVEINARPGAVSADCSDLPADTTFVKVYEAPPLLYLYNETGFFALHANEIEPLRYYDCPLTRTRT